MRKLPIALLSGAMFFSIVAGASAETTGGDVQEYSLDPVVVTATKTEKKASEVPASVSVITAEDIKKLGATSVDQALIMTPGVYIPRLSGMASTISQTAMRGLNAANSTLVMVDGQPLNDTYNGSVVWSSIPIDNVERIEVVRGSASTLYGSSAMGGVINIITKTPKTSSGSMSVRYGSHNSWDNNFNYNVRVNDKLNMEVLYEHKSTDGYITDQVIKNGALIGDMGARQWDEENVGVKMKYQLDHDRTLRIAFLRNHYEYTYGTPHSYIGANVFANASTYFSTPGGKTSQLYSLNYADTRKGWDATVGFNDVTDQYNTKIGSKQYVDNPCDRLFFDVRKNTALSAKDVLTTGFHYDKERMRAKIYNLSNGFDSSSTTSLKSFAEGNAESFAVYARNEHALDKKWSLGTGVRFDQWAVEGKSQLNTYAERTFTQMSPSASLQYQADSRTTTYLSWGKAFEAPSLYRTFSESTSGTKTNYGNPDLTPQTSESLELGVKRKVSDKANLALSVYHTDYTNLLTKKTLTGGNTMYVNAGKAEVNGLEVEYKAQPTEQFSYFANYTRQNPVIKESTVTTSVNKYVTAIPREVFRIGTTYHKAKMTGTLTGEYVSKRYSNDDNSDVGNGVYGSYDPYFLVNLNLQYEINKDTSVSLGVENLLNRQYFNYYYAPDRSYYVQLTHKI